MANGSRTRVGRAPKAEADEVEAEAEELNGVSSALKKASLDLGTTSASTIVVHVVTLFVFVRPPPPPRPRCTARPHARARAHRCFRLAAPALLPRPALP